MAAFPKPPPLTLKPESWSIPEDVRKKIARPHLFTQLVIMAGCISMGVALLIGFVVYVLLRPVLVQWDVPTILSLLAIGGIGWAGFILGAHTVQRVICEALRADE